MGSVSRTDVAVCYMDNLVDKKLLGKLTREINNIKVKSLTMNQQSLIEAIYKHKWYNPFPKVKYTERPDSAASAILEGNIIILVDNSPSALVLPTSIFDIIEEVDDYYFRRLPARISALPAILSRLLRSSSRHCGCLH